MTTYNIATTTPSAIYAGDILNCPYTGTIKSITLPIGMYLLECWGAKGGGHPGSLLSGANGGYSKGVINLTEETTLYLVCGGRGTQGSTTQNHAGGYNGGGTGRYYSGGGGGATHIALKTGLLSSLATDQTQILMVAGGGSGSASNNTNHRASLGSGGGTNGKNGNFILLPNSTANYTHYFGLGGTQTRGGYALNNNTVGVGSFGQGGTATGNYSSGGGGGYFGGGGASNYATGGGGSGYINEYRIINGMTKTETGTSNPDATNYHGYIRITAKLVGIEPGVYIKINGEWRMIENGLI